MFIFNLILLLTVHTVADFMMQTEWEGMNKSKDIKALLSHVLNYTGMIGCASFALSTQNWWLFTLITGVCHFITDYFTSKMTSKRYKEGKFYGFNGFWSVIGIDQLLHIVQIILTLKLVENI